MNDHSLLERLKNGDPSAMEAIHKRYYEMVYNITHAITKNAYDAEDLAGEVLLDIYERGADIKITTSEVVYIKAMARNRALDFKKKNTKNPIISVFNIGEIVASTPDPAKLLEMKETQQLLNKAINNLPGLKHRQSFVLAHIEKKRHREIGGVLRLKTDVVKRYVHEARKKLADMLKKVGITR